MPIQSRSSKITIFKYILYLHEELDLKAKVSDSHPQTGSNHVHRHHGLVARASIVPTERKVFLECLVSTIEQDRVEAQIGERGATPPLLHVYKEIENGQDEHATATVDQAEGG